MVATIIMMAATTIKVASVIVVVIAAIIIMIVMPKKRVIFKLKSKLLVLKINIEYYKYFKNKNELKIISISFWSNTFL